MKRFTIRNIRQAARRLRGRFGPRAVVLLYHRVTEAEADPYMLRVTPQHFAEHMQVIREVGFPMRLSELACHVRDGKLPERAVCVTFDDGYDDNLETAKPLLEQHDMPATVFMTTGTIGRRREFWWDELERVFLQPGSLPPRLRLDVGGQHFDWELGASAVYGEADVQRDKAWTMPVSEDPNSPHDPTTRHSVLRAVHQLLLWMGQTERQQVLDLLLDWAGLTPTVRTTHRALEPAEILDLARGGLVEIGSHTVNHLALTTQPANVQGNEIRQSKAMLDQLLGHAVQGFAYPYGFASKASVAAVRAADFLYACGGESWTVRRHSQLFLLPRVEVLNWDGERFACFLRTQLNG